MDSEFVKKRLEKDLQELKKMIEKHFEQRKEDEASIQQLEERIVKRKELRAQQLEERAKVKNLKKSKFSPKTKILSFPEDLRRKHIWLTGVYCIYSNAVGPQNLDERLL